MTLDNSLGFQNRKGREKGRVDLCTVKVVEAVEPTPELIPASILPGSKTLANFGALTSGVIPSELKGSSALQIVYNPYQCNDNGSPTTDVTLCIFTPTEQERDDWLWSIRLGMSFHPLL